MIQRSSIPAEYFTPWGRIRTVNISPIWDYELEEWGARMWAVTIINDGEVEWTIRLDTSEARELYDICIDWSE